MRRLELLGIALMTSLSVIVAMAGSAEAGELKVLSPHMKFSFSHPTPSTAQTLSGKRLECSSVTGSGEMTSERLGVAEVKFVGCSTQVLGLTVKCTGLEAGDKEGEVLIKVEFHFRHLLINGNPSEASLMILLGHAHLTCAGVLFLKLGSICSDELLTAKGGESAINRLLSSGFAAFLGSNGDAVVHEVDTDNSLGMETCEVLLKEGTSESNKYESATVLSGEGTVESFKNEKNETVTGLLDETGTF